MGPDEWEYYKFPACPSFTSFMNQCSTASQRPKSLIHLGMRDHVRPISRCAFHHGAYSFQKNLTLASCEVDLRTINTLLTNHETMFTQDSSIFPAEGLPRSLAVIAATILVSGAHLLSHAIISFHKPHDASSVISITSPACRQY